MELLSHRVGRYIVSAATFLGFAAIAAWIFDRAAETLHCVVQDTLVSLAGQVESTTDSLMKLVGVIEPVEQVPQQTDPEYAEGDLLEDPVLPDDLDWTERAEQEIDPEFYPETPIIPLDSRRVTTGMPLPDMAGEY